jgi:hypothetical protein
MAPSNPYICSPTPLRWRMVKIHRCVILKGVPVDTQCMPRVGVELRVRLQTTLTAVLSLFCQYVSSNISYGFGHEVAIISYYEEVEEVQSFGRYYSPPPPPPEYKIFRHWHLLFYNAVFQEVFKFVASKLRKTKTIMELLDGRVICEDHAL